MGKEDIKRLRVRLGWTQQRLADELGISRNAVAQWEMGVRNPSPMALKFMERLSRDLDEPPPD